jgi:hypothetical protein
MHKWSSRNQSSQIILIKKEVQGGGCHGRGRHVGEGEGGFIKDDMARNKNAVRLKLQTSVAFVFGGVTEEHT